MAYKIILLTYNKWLTFVLLITLLINYYLFRFLNIFVLHQIDKKKKKKKKKIFFFKILKKKKKKKKTVILKLI